MHAVPSSTAAAACPALKSKLLALLAGGSGRGRRRRRTNFPQNSSAKKAELCKSRPGNLMFSSSSSASASCLVSCHLRIRGKEAPPPRLKKWDDLLLTAPAYRKRERERWVHLLFLHTQQSFRSHILSPILALGSHSWDAQEEGESHVSKWRGALAGRRGN